MNPAMQKSILINSILILLILGSYWAWEGANMAKETSQCKFILSKAQDAFKEYCAEEAKQRGVEKPAGEIDEYPSDINVISANLKKRTEKHYNVEATELEVFYNSASLNGIRNSHHVVAYIQAKRHNGYYLLVRNPVKFNASGEFSVVFLKELEFQKLFVDNKINAEKLKEAVAH